MAYKLYLSPSFKRIPIFIGPKPLGNLIQSWLAGTNYYTNNFNLQKLSSMWMYFNISSIVLSLKIHASISLSNHPLQDLLQKFSYCYTYTYSLIFIYLIMSACKYVDLNKLQKVFLKKINILLLGFHTRFSCTLIK